MGAAVARRGDLEGAQGGDGDVKVERRSGLVVPMPELEPIVGDHRRAWDPVAALGAGAHVTVLFPFAPPDRVDERLRDRIACALVGFAPFAVHFDAVRFFPDHVLYVAPEPAARFRALTEALATAFPEFPPYRGQFAEIVPHLTVAHRPDAPIAAIAAAVEPLLPVDAHASRVELWEEGTDDRWSTRATFPLSGVRT
jgi:2'-5' RNA ligase